MTDISQLTDFLSALPCEYAKSAGLSSSDIPISSADNDLCLETGFPEKYSSLTGRKDVKRDDMNRIGALATRELMFRRSGGVHEYETNSESAGYSEGAVVSYDDSVFLKDVESQFAENNINIITQPYAVDGLVTKTGDQVPKIWWKSSGYIHGISAALVGAGGNFSEAVYLTPVEDDTGAGIVPVDSLVSIGDYIYGFYSEVGSVFGSITVDDQLNNMIATLTITPPNGDAVEIVIPCKGRNGVLAATTGVLFWTQVFPAELCGNSNFDMCFFAKAGTKIKCYLNANEKDNSDKDPRPTPWTPSGKGVSRIKCYPLMISIKEFADD